MARFASGAPAATLNKRPSRSSRGLATPSIWAGSTFTGCDQQLLAPWHRVHRSNDSGRPVRFRYDRPQLHTRWRFCGTCGRIITERGGATPQSYRRAPLFAADPGSLHPVYTLPLLLWRARGCCPALARGPSNTVH